MSGSSGDDPQGGQGPGRVAGVVSQGGGEVHRPGAAQRADGQVAQAGHDVGAGAGSDPRGVLGKGGVANVVQAVLDRPVPAEVVGEPGRASLGEGEAGDRIDRHGPPPPGPKLAGPAGDLEDLAACGKPKWSTVTALRCAGPGGRGRGHRCGPGRGMRCQAKPAQRSRLVLTQSRSWACLPASRGRNQGTSPGAPSTCRWARTVRVWSIQASRWTCRPWAPLPRSVLPSTATTVAVGRNGRGRPARRRSRRPGWWRQAGPGCGGSWFRWGPSTPSGRCGDRDGLASAARTGWGASAAHSVIAAIDRAPAKTAAAASTWLRPMVPNCGPGQHPTTPWVLW